MERPPNIPPQYQLKRRRKKLRIAICDDDKNLLIKLKPKLYEYANSHRIEFVIEAFFSGEALLASKNVFDMIFLDYKMGKHNGLDTAKKIREQNKDCAIVFMTGFKDEFILDAFAVQPFRFLIKPLSAKRLWEVFDAYFSMYGFDYPILVKGAARETVRLNSKNIVFIEANNKHCMIHLQDRILHCTRTMAGLFKEMPHHHFFKVNRAFIINFNYVYKYDNTKITCSNGETVSVSRKYLTAFKAAFKEYSDLRVPAKDSVICKFL